MADENETETDQGKDVIMLKRIIEWLKLPEDTTENAAMERLQAMQSELIAATTTAQESATARETLANERTAAESKIVDLTALADAANAKATAAETALANERGARIDLIVADAIHGKRITPAQADAWKTRLAKPETFEVELTALANEKSGANVSPRTSDLGARVGRTVERQNQILSLVNECQEKDHVDYETAWQRVKKTHPDLFKGTEG